MIKSLKHSIWFLILLFGLSSAQAATPTGNPAQQAPAQPAPSENAPALEIPETVFDFGEAMEGGEVTHDFTVKNNGKGALQIDQVRPG